MSDFAAASERLIAAYNAKDFDGLAALIALGLDFAHYNRDFVLTGRDALLDVLREFAANYIPDRRFEPGATCERVRVEPAASSRSGWICVFRR